MHCDEVMEPPGFDFTWTELRSAGQWIADAAGPQIRLNLEAVPGEEVVVRLDGVQLGIGGGMAYMQLTTSAGRACALSEGFAAAIARHEDLLSVCLSSCSVLKWGHLP